MHIKNLLQDFESDPSTAVWNGVQERLIKDEKRKRGFWFLILFLLAGVTGLTWKSYDSIHKIKLQNSVEQNASTIRSTSHPLNTEPATTSINYSSQKITVEKINSGRSSNPESNSLQQIWRSQSPGLLQHSSQKENGPSAKTNGGENSQPLLASTLSLINLPLNLFESGSSIPSALENSTISPSGSKHYCRWEAGIYYGIGKSFRHYHSASSSGEGINLKQNEKAIQSTVAGLRFFYDVNTRITLQSGIDYFTSGMERTFSMIKASGPPENQVYTIASSFSELQGNDLELNEVFFDDPSVSLIMPSAGAGDDKIYRKFSLVEKFNFVSVPLTVVVKATERRLTPFASLGVSGDYLVDWSVYVNGQRVNYFYTEKPNRWSASAMVSAGIAFAFNSRISLLAQPSFRYSITSLSGNKKTSWHPYSYTGSVGLNYRF